MTRDDLIVRMLDGLISQAQTLRDMIVSSVDLDKSDTTDSAPAPSSDGSCDHPEDRRIPIPVMGDPARWICGVCSHRNEKEPS